MKKLISAALLGASGIAVVIIATPGCTCKGNESTVKAKVSPTPLPKVPVIPPSARPSGRSIRRATLREPMEEIQKVTEEMGRRAQGRVSMAAPSVLLLKLLNKLPAKSSQASFRTYLDAVKDRAKILKDSKNLREDFNSLIDACQACHRVYSLRSIPPVKKLRVSLKDDAGPGTKTR